MPVDADPPLLKMSDVDDALWAVQVSDGNKMPGSKRFSQVVVSETGHMAVMNMLDARTFISLKTRLAAIPRHRLI